MHVEDLEPEVVIASILSKRGLFLKIGAEVKNVFEMRKENMPTTTL